MFLSLIMIPLHPVPIHYYYTTIHYYYAKKTMQMHYYTRTTYSIHYHDYQDFLDSRWIYHQYQHLQKKSAYICKIIGSNDGDECSILFDRLSKSLDLVRNFFLTNSLCILILIAVSIRAVL